MSLLNRWCIRVVFLLDWYGVSFLIATVRTQGPLDKMKDEERSLMLIFSGPYLYSTAIADKHKNKDSYSMSDSFGVDYKL